MTLVLLKILVMIINLAILAIFVTLFEKLIDWWCSKNVKR